MRLAGEKKAEKPKFKEFTISVVVESEDEANALSTLFNTVVINDVLDTVFKTGDVFFDVLHGAFASKGFSGGADLPNKLTDAIRNHRQIKGGK